MTCQSWRVLGLAAVAVAAGVVMVAGPADPARADNGSGQVRGLVRPVHQSSIANDLGVRVEKLNVREAQPFKAGDVLLSFDCERLEAEYAAADATFREMQLTLDSNIYLDAKRAIGKLDVEVSRARADRAGAEARALKARLKQCELVAPFDGRVVELTINTHEIPAPGKPFITLVDETKFEIDLIVPSSYLRHLKPGDTFNYRVDETSRDYEAHILRIGAAVDPVSQTVKIIAAFSKPDAYLLSGMSGTAFIVLPEASQ